MENSLTVGERGFSVGRVQTDYSVAAHKWMGSLSVDC